MPNPYSHYDAIQQRRAIHTNEIANGASGAKLAHHEHQLRMIDREIDGEIEFLKSRGVDTAPLTTTVDDISDEELLRLLGAL